MKRLKKWLALTIVASNVLLTAFQGMEVRAEGTSVSIQTTVEEDSDSAAEETDVDGVDDDIKDEEDGSGGVDVPESEETESEVTDSETAEPEEPQPDETEPETTEPEETEPGGTDSETTVPEEMLPGEVDSETVEPDGVDGAKASETDNATEDMDYVLGRPMTDEELEERKALAEQMRAYNGYIELPDAPSDIKLAPDTSIVWGTLPSSYDSRDVSAVRPIRNQNPYGTCWSFSGIACMEGSLIRKWGKAVDLSPMHLAFFTHYSAPDPLENDYNDSVEYTGNIEGLMNGGGNVGDAHYGLACWKGAVKEEDAEYVSPAQPLSRTKEVAYLTDFAHLQGFYYIDKTDVNAVKSKIMEYGAVSASYYDHDNYLNEQTAAYYCNVGNIGTNHAVAIVGWDDNYSVNNFNVAIRPSSNGAWLVRNSWGDWFGDNGYFWLSYEDASLYNTMYAFYVEPADNYDNNYQYDFVPDTQYFGVSKVASVFEAKANGNKREELKAVAIDLSYSANVSYSIQIYKNPGDLSDPTSGTPMLSRPQTGETTFAGYYTVPLTEKVVLDPGDKFSVVFSLESLSGKTIYVSSERSNTWNGRKSIASARAGESYMWYGYRWIDHGAEENANLRIKAFTDNLEETLVVPTGIKLNKSSATVQKGRTVTLAATVTPSNAANKSVHWSSSNSRVATVDGNGVVTGVSRGEAVITAKTENGKYSATCKVKVEVEVTDVYFRYQYSGYTIGSKAEVMTAYAVPSDANQTLRWTSSNTSIATVDSKGTVTFKALGEVTITATSTNGKSHSEKLNATLPAGGYIGNINSELISFDLKHSENGYYLTGEIVVVEWVDGKSTVPTVKPKMTFKSTDGKEKIEVFVTPTGTNTYYFDRFIEGLSAGKEYVFEIASGDTNNYSTNKSMNVSLATSPRMVPIKNLGKIGSQKISYYKADNGEMRLFRRISNYIGNINSELKKTELVTGPNGNYVSGEIVVVEWENGVSTVPFETPKMYFKSTDGKESLPVFVTPTGTNTYYFDRSLGDMDTAKEYVFVIESGDKLNVSPNKSMIVTTAAMENKTGTLWESATQYVRYRTDSRTGELRVYAVNK